MTPLEEKKCWQTKFLNAGTKEIGIDCSILISVVSEIISDKVEEYKKELLEKLPEITEQEESDFQCDFDDQIEAYEQKGYNEAISDIRNIISKPNI